MAKDQGETMSLYDVWDHAISEVRKKGNSEIEKHQSWQRECVTWDSRFDADEVVRMQESNFWLGGWTHVRAVGRAPSDKTLLEGLLLETLVASWKRC